MSCSPSCLPTCYEPNPFCTPNTDCVPGCGCPDGKVFDQQQQQCVLPSDCCKFKKVLSYIVCSFIFQQLVVSLLILVHVEVGFHDGFITLPQDNVNCFFMEGVLEIEINLIL